MNWKNRKFKIFLGCLLFLLLILPIQPARAFFIEIAENTMLKLIGLVAMVVVQAIGMLISVVIDVLIQLSTYNNFINEVAIVEAWKIILGLSNMVFVVALLVIAFASILRMENYRFSQLLPKLVMAAIFINFSRMICGLIIDIGQIIMLTFISTLGTTGGSYINTLGVAKYVTNASGWNNLNFQDVNFFSTVTGILLSVVFLLIALVVLVVLLGIIAIRIVYLWIYVTLSPLAFAMSVLPSTRKYTDRYWSEFISQIVVGPALAFFLWLAFSASAQIQAVGNVNGVTNVCFGPAQILCPADFLHFVIAIGMLIGGMQIAGSLGGAAGGMVSRGMGAINKGKGWATGKAKLGARATGRFGFGVAKGSDRLLGMAANKGLSKLASGLSGKKKEVNLFSGGVVGSTYQYGKNLATLQPIRDVMRNRFEQKKSLYDYWAESRVKGDKALLNYQGKKWKKGDEGKFFQVDDKGNKLTTKKKYYDEHGNVREERDEPITINAEGINRFGKKKELKEMGNVGARWYETMFATNTNAMAAAKVAQDTKIREEQKKIANSNMSAAMVRESLNDNSRSKSWKQAAALHLSGSGYFKDKDRGETEFVEKYVSDNHLLHKQFREDIMKKTPSKWFDLESEQGIKDFEKAHRDGKIEKILDPSEYTAPVIKAMEKALGDKTTQKYLEDAGARDKTTFDKIGKALQSLVKLEQKKVFDEKGGVMHERVLATKFAGSIASGFSGMNLADAKIKSDIGNALKQMTGKFTPKEYANLDAESFTDSHLREHFGDQAETFKGMLKEALKENMSEKTMNSVGRHADSSKQLMDRYSEYTGRTWE